MHHLRKIVMMARFSILIPDELAETVRARADRDGVSLAEIGRRALSAWCTADGVPDAPPCTTAPEPSETSTTALRDAIARADMLASDLAAVTAERDRAREDLDALRTRADQAEAVAAERLTRIADLRADLDAERERSRSDVIQAAALAVRAALPSSSTTADQDQARPGILDGIRAWLRR